MTSPASYSKTAWNPDAPPAVNAAALNKMETGIADAVAAANRAGTAAGTTVAPGQLVSSTDVQGAIMELDAEGMKKTDGEDVALVVALVGNTPQSGEGRDGDLGRGRDGSWWGPKANGAWPGAARLADNLTAAAATISGATTLGGAVHQIANSRTGTITLTAASARTQFCSAAAAFTLTLWAGATVGQEYVIVKTDASANAVTVVPGSGTINGAASYVLTAQYKYVRVEFAGVNWFITGSN